MALPYWPTRCWLKNTGPLEDTLIASATTRKTGAKTTSTSELPIMSIVRFMIERQSRALVTLRQVGIQHRVTWSLGHVMIPLVRKEVKRDADLIELLESQVISKNVAYPGQHRAEERVLLVNDKICKHDPKGTLVLIPANRVSFPG